MKRIAATISMAVLAGLTFAACSSGSTTAPSTTSRPPYIFAAKGPCQSYAQANPTAQVATTADYVIVANMGPSESMYTPAQAASSHPMSGEIMVSGTMDSGMPMGSGIMDHIEAHICSKSTGTVMTDIMPTMHLQATGSGGRASSVPIAKMQGLDWNPADTHYGNNVVITPGRRYHVAVMVNGQTANLTLKATASAVPTASVTPSATRSPTCTGFELMLAYDRGGQPSPVAAANWLSAHGGVPDISSQEWPSQSR